MKRMKKTVALVLVGAMVLAISITAYAKEEKDVKPYNNIQEILKENEILRDITLLDENIARVPMAPLTDMQVLWVNSQNAGEENISAGQYSTKLDHGGDWVQVITLERGFSSVRWAYFNNVEMEATDSDYVNFDGDNVMDGVLRLWTLNTRFTDGKFKYKAWSVRTSKEFNTWNNGLY